MMGMMGMMGMITIMEMKNGEFMGFHRQIKDGDFHVFFGGLHGDLMSLFIRIYLPVNQPFALESGLFCSTMDLLEWYFPWLC